MEWHVSKSRGHQSVHDKALTIFQERIKSLAVAEREIEKERIQSNIELKTEKRKVQEDLFNLNRDRKRFAREARNKLQLHQLPCLVSREKTFQGLSVRDKQKLLRSFSTERSADTFPLITCTDANVPQIMKRSISRESQFHNWVIGFPRIKDSSSKRTLRNKKLAKQGAKHENSDAGAVKRHSKVENIVFNVPVTLTNGKASARHDQVQVNHQKRRKGVVTSWNVKNEKLPKLKDILGKD